MCFKTEEKSSFFKTALTKSVDLNSRILSNFSNFKRLLSPQNQGTREKNIVNHIKIGTL